MIFRYSINSENQRANVRVQFSKSTDLYKNLYDDKPLNDSFENEHQLENKNSKIILKKICNTPASASTNFTADNLSENRLKTPSTNNTSYNRKSIKIGQNIELGTISEETKKMNDDSDNYSETSKKYIIIIK